MLLRLKNNMVTWSWAFVVILLISLPCAFGEPDDANINDVEVADAAVADTESVDSGVADEEVADVETTDTEVSDAAVTDAEAADSGVPDEEIAGDEAADSEVPDAAVADVEAADSEVPDAKVAGAGPAGDVRVKEETGFYYTVKKGDTLWDISKHFFDSPWLWPDLWSENSQIHNPHLIYPGNRIRIYQKDGVIYISQVPAEEPKEEPKEEPPVEPEVQEEPPVEEVAAVEPPEEEPKFEDPNEGKNLPAFPYVNIDAIGFVRKEAATPLGYIFRIKDGIILGSKGNIVYIKQKEENAPKLIPGNLYSVFRIQEKPVKDPESKDYVGIQHDLKGVVEVTEILQENPLIAEGKIVRNFRDISPDDLLMPYQRKSPMVPLKKTPDGLIGKILLSEDHGKIFGEQTLVFINIGSQDGVIPGQEYNIFFKEKLDEDFEKSINIGQLLVLHTEATTATALITKTKRNVEPGMEIRSAQR